MTSTFKLKLMTGVAAAAVTVMTAGTANATFGMLPHCVGTVKCGMAGAGSGRGVGAVDATVNPAVGTQMGNEYQVNLGYFKAKVRGQTNVSVDNGSTYTQGAKESSSADGFPNGSLGVNYVLDGSKTFNVSIVPGGGGASKWATSRTSAAGQTTNDQEITYEMVYLQPSMAFKVSDDVSYGVGAILSRATMKTDSVYPSTTGTLGQLTATSDPNSKATYYGVGFQAGGVWGLSGVGVNSGTFALNYRSPVWHQDTGNVYNNTVFISPVDTPQQITAGVSFEPVAKTTVSMDYKWVNWSGVETIGQAPSNITAGEGSLAGFGWVDQHIIMLGVEHQLSDATRVRAGYSVGNSPIPDRYVFANYLFPAIVEQHITIGADTDINNGMNIGFSAYITPKAKQVSEGGGGAFSTMGAGTTLEHQQYGFQLSFSNDF